MALEISSEQMLAFEQQARARFIKQAGPQLSARQPQEASKLTPAELQSYIEEGTRRAEELGLKTDESILEFLELGLLPEQFRQTPLVREVTTRVLANDNLAIVQRVHFLHTQLVKRAVAS